VKLLVTSDWHLDATTLGVSRLREFDGYLSAMIAAIDSERVEHVLVLGDYFDPGRLSAHELTSKLKDIAFELSMAGAGTRVSFLAGNHDTVESSEGWTTLSPLAAAVRRGFGDGYVSVYERPSFARLGSFRTARVVGFLFLPYVAVARERTERHRDDLATAFREAADARFEAGLPLVVAGHLTVPGARLGSESAEMSRGREVDFPSGKVRALRPALTLNGHYHRSQVVRAACGLEVVIPGSPHRFRAGERDDAHKGFLIAEVDDAPAP
jgi:DNA repair exonuclease SbcCD nuclease subunit